MLRHFTVFLLAATALAGCADDDSNLVQNACTDHPMYGAGNPMVTIETNFGNITAEIFVDKVPNTGMNFVKLAEAGSYNGSVFHRIITNFMMQGGNYDGVGGTAHADCALPNGNIEDEFRADLKHTGKGILSMANTGHSDSGSSQFFITFGATSHLDAYDASGNKKECGAVDQFGRPTVSCHAVFGQVTAGTAVMDAVNSQAASSGGAPRTPVEFKGATVTWP